MIHIKTEAGTKEYPVIEAIEKLKEGYEIDWKKFREIVTMTQMFLRKEIQSQQLMVKEDEIPILENIYDYQHLLKIYKASELTNDQSNLSLLLKFEGLVDRLKKIRLTKILKIASMSLYGNATISPSLTKSELYIYEMVSNFLVRILDELF